MKELNELLVVLTVVVAAILMVFIITRYSYLVKKAMIERGVVLNQNNDRFKYLDIGCIAFGLGIGLVASSIFTTMELTEDTMDLLIWGTILIFGAGGLVLAHFIRKRLEK
ncbi:hypothetical protein FK220_008570 [Flavobacteriaceae bacterium TP-CH-4]|uniref:Uncharacterized protein n=1 Tax=Pelagihabitans pacificus TaxID=2696054 RepID=A0A967AU16_9FLAO|nr:hypothetical protein [Pelagihabitans pacificus]NHF59390.1 hypothetical protein [Pelagihabitans pacificus]